MSLYNCQSTILYLCLKSHFPQRPLNSNCTKFQEKVRIQLAAHQPQRSLPSSRFQTIFNYRPMHMTPEDD